VQVLPSTEPSHLLSFFFLLVIVLLFLVLKLLHFRLVIDVTRRYKRRIIVQTLLVFLLFVHSRLALCSAFGAWGSDEKRQFTLI
jgi:glucan phosphoethanolaminetransferase (alkaline phosphatase superfamily)